MERQKKQLSQVRLWSNPALRKGVNILRYRQGCSVRHLRDGLERCGYADAQIEDAIAELIDCGLLDEADQVNRLAEYMGNVQCYGKKRILLSLYQKGYSQEAIDEIDFSVIDFVLACKKRFQKCYPKEVAALRSGEADQDEEEHRLRKKSTPKEKLCVVALRYGYSYAQAMAALDALCEDEE